MNRLFIFMLVLLASLTGRAQLLKFHSNGEFKIVQFTDIHYQDNAESKVALDCIDKVLDAEKPDLIVLTGDIIWGKPAKGNLLTVLNCISKHNIPFAYEFGNHDWEQGLSNRELYSIARSVKNNILPDLSTQPELDYTLKIRSHDGSNDAAVLYCMDSHAYPKGFPDDKSKGTYAWLTFEQVEWYRQQSKAITAANDGKPLPALAFFHIALPEYHAAAKDENAVLIGTRREEACSPEFNSGMFLAMMEGEDVMGVFVGHDHDNDYSVMWHNILLAYGRYSGGNTVYNHLPNGGRVIILKEGKHEFETYIRERKGQIVDRSAYPYSYIADDWTKRPLEK